MANRIEKWIQGYMEKNLKEVQNKDVKQKEKGADIPSKRTRYRYRQTLTNWTQAIQLAEKHEYPDWKYLLDIYKNMVMDSKIWGKVSNRKNKTILQEFRLVDKDGEVDEELTNKFKQRWFSKFMDLSIDAIFYGWSLIQIGDIEDDIPIDIEMIDRYYIIPEQKKIKKELNNTSEGIPFDEGDIAKFMIWVETYDSNKVTNLGLFSKIAQYFLYKKETLSMYSEFIEVYGMPIRTAKIGAASDYDSVENMMKNMGSNAWGIFDENTDITTTESGVENYDNIYQRLIDYLDDQISTMITGETMDNSTNYSQSQAFIKWADQTSYMDNKFIEDVVNNQLLPTFLNLGLDVYKDIRFEFYYKETKTPEEQFMIEAKLLEFFDIEPEYFENKYGVDIIGKKEEKNLPPLNSKKIDEFYRYGKGLKRDS